MSEIEMLIDAIEAIRARNNTNWMTILRIAFREAPDETRHVVRHIIKCDIEINEFLVKMAGRL